MKTIIRTDDEMLEFEVEEEILEDEEFRYFQSKDNVSIAVRKSAIIWSATAPDIESIKKNLQLFNYNMKAEKDA